MTNREIFDKVFSGWLGCRFGTQSGDTVMITVGTDRSNPERQMSVDLETWFDYWDFPTPTNLRMEDADLGEAVEILNEICHPNGFHLFRVRDELLKNLWDVEESGRNFMDNIRHQIRYWRNGKPDEIRTILLSAEDMEVLECAIEVYNWAILTRYLEPALKRLEEDLRKENW